MTQTSFTIFIEYFVRLQIFIIAAVYAIKELYFEYSNQGIATRLNTDIKNSPILQNHRKVAVVTGADGTIGYEVTKRLLALGFEVKALVKSRNYSLLEGLVEQYSNGRKLTLYKVDLECPSEITQIKEQVYSNFGTVHLVVLCAGIMLAKEKYINEMESHMCVNLVSQAVILDALRDNFCRETRIAALSSTCLRAAYNDDQLNRETLFNKYIGPYHAYSMSKLALTMYINELAQESGLKVVTLHPGVVPGRLYRNVNVILKLITYIILPFIMRTPTFAAQLVLHTALRTDIENGAYYEDLEVKNVLDWYTDRQKKAVYNAVCDKVKQMKG